MPNYEESSNASDSTSSRKPSDSVRYQEIRMALLQNKDFKDLEIKGEQDAKFFREILKDFVGQYYKKDKENPKVENIYLKAINNCIQVARAHNIQNLVGSNITDFQILFSEMNNASFNETQKTATGNPYLLLNALKHPPIVKIIIEEYLNELTSSFNNFLDGKEDNIQLAINNLKEIIRLASSKDHNLNEEINSKIVELINKLSQKLESDSLKFSLFAIDVVDLLQKAEEKASKNQNALSPEVAKAVDNLVEKAANMELAFNKKVQEAIKTLQLKLTPLALSAGGDTSKIKVRKVQGEVAKILERDYLSPSEKIYQTYVLLEGMRQEILSGKGSTANIAPGNVAPKIPELIQAFAKDVGFENLVQIYTKGRVFKETIIKFNDNELQPFKALAQLKKMKPKPISQSQQAEPAAAPIEVKESPKPTGRGLSK